MLFVSLQICSFCEERLPTFFLHRKGQIRDIQQLFSGKYRFGEANIAYNFLLLEDGYKFLDDRSIHEVTIFETYLINFLRFSDA